MKTWPALILVLLSGTIGRAESTTGMGQFRGYTAVEKIFSARVMPDGTPFSLARYGLPTPLLDLMGTWSNPAAQRIYRNGTPNAVNVLLWYLNLNSFAEEVAARCKPLAPGAAHFDARFETQVKSMCLWPAPAAKDEAAMTAYWRSLIGFDAPESEYLAWRDFFLNSSFKSRAGAETVRAMTLAILMNPYFLLQD